MGSPCHVKILVPWLVAQNHKLKKSFTIKSNSHLLNTHDYFCFHFSLCNNQINQNISLYLTKCFFCSYLFHIDRALNGALHGVWPAVSRAGVGAVGIPDPFCHLRAHAPMRVVMSQVLKFFPIQVWPLTHLDSLCTIYIQTYPMIC